MFSFLNKKKPKKETSLIFVIESGKVISAVMHFDAAKPPEFLYTHKHNIAFQQNVDPQRLEDLMLGTLKQSAEKASKEGLVLYKHDTKTPIKTYIFLGSPWYMPTYSKAEMSKEKSFVISEDLVKKISEEKFDSENKDNLIIEHKIISVKANGYDVLTVKNQKVDEIVVASLFSGAPKKLLGQIESMIKLSIVHTDFIYHTTAQVVFPIAKELIKKDDFVIYIPEHEVSDLVVVRHGHIEKMVTIPFGKHSPVRALSNNANNPSNANKADASQVDKRKADEEKVGSHSLVMMYLSDKLAADERERVKVLLDISKVKFLEILREALWKLSSTIFLPEDIIISDGHPISKLLGEWILTEEFTSRTMTIKNFSISFMENKDIIGKVVTKEKAEYLNPFIISAGLYLNSI